MKHRAGIDRIEHALRGAALILVTFAGIAASPSTAAASEPGSDSEAWTVYQGFVEACASATTMEDLLPFLPEWRHMRNEAADEAARKETLGRLCKDAKELAEIAFVSQEGDRDKAILHLKASWDGLPMKGKVTVVREDDGPKVEEWFWATGQ